MTEEASRNDQLTEEERELAERLNARRPAPAAGFRGALGRRLAARDPGYSPRPERLRAAVSAYLGAGALMLAAGALHASGVL
jgi:hypothetical protein